MRRCAVHRTTRACRGSPLRGCACFEREPGADDVPDWAPPGVNRDPVGDYYRAIRAVQQRSPPTKARPGQA
jgi:hypothetical protein